jgi:hypothetical protein
MCSGCVAAAVGLGATAGVGTYTYIKGELKATYSVPLAQAWDASVMAMHTMHIPIAKQAIDALGGEITARRADGTPVKVKLKPIGNFSTDIGVRVGGIASIWSQKDAQRVHDAIKHRLDEGRS